MGEGAFARVSPLPVPKLSADVNGGCCCWDAMKSPPEATEADELSPGLMEWTAAADDESLDDPYGPTLKSKTRKTNNYRHRKGQLFQT